MPLFLTSKAFLGGIAAIMSFAAMVPYILGIIRGNTVPHIISWLIWGIASLSIFAAQWLNHGGAGSWANAAGGIMPFIVIILALIYAGDRSIKRSDWLILAISLIALLLWALSNNALIAVAILTFIDVIGYIPTIRKAWHRPYEEQTLMFNIMTLRNIISLVALEQYSTTTLLFNSATSVANIMLVGIIYFRRTQITA